MFTSFDFGPLAFYRDRAVTVIFLSLPFGRKLGFGHRKCRVWSPLFNGFILPPLRKRVSVFVWNARKEA